MAKIVDFSKEQISININFRRDMITAASLLKTWQVTSLQPEFKAVREALAKASSEQAVEHLSKQLYGLLKQQAAEVLAWLEGLESGVTQIAINSYYSATEEYIRILSAGNKYNLLGTPEEMVRIILIRRAKKQLVRLTNSMEKLEKHQFKALEYTEAYLEGVDIQNEALVYEDQLIVQDQFNFYSSYAKPQEYARLLEALDVIAYFRGRPCLAKQAQTGHDELPLNRYTHFQLIDLLSIHEPAVTEQRSPFYISSMVLPYFKETPGKYAPVLRSAEIPQPQILRLYHQALQLRDPIEHYHAMCKVYAHALTCPDLELPPHSSEAELLQYYYEKALGTDLIPMYYLDSGLEYDAEKNEFHLVREQTYKDIIEELKLLSQHIIKSWKTDENKELGALFDALAKAQFYASSAQAQEQHFGNLLEVENIFMELVVCYLIETLNPALREFVHTDKKLVCPTIVG